MAKIKFDELVSGAYIQTKKDGKVFLVEEVDTDARKALLLAVETQAEKELSASTIERFYAITEAPAKVEPEVTEAEVEEAVKEVEAKLEKAEEKAEEEKSAPAKPRGPRVRRPRITPTVPDQEEVKPAEEPKVTEPSEDKVVEEDIEVPEADKEVEEVALPKATAKKSALKLDHIMEISSSLQQSLKEIYTDSVRVVTESYTSYRKKYTFVEIYESTRRIHIHVRTDAMTPEQIEKLDRVYPKSYGWVLNGKFSIQSVDDIATALDLIAESYHSVTMK